MHDATEDRIIFDEQDGGQRPSGHRDLPHG
jgi:hypothetical protein